MKNTYLACADEYEGKYMAYVLKVSSGQNLAGDLAKGLGYLISDWPDRKTIRGRRIIATICESRKEAEKLATDWNDAWDEAGKFGFDALPWTPGIFPHCYTEYSFR